MPTLTNIYGLPAPVVRALSRSDYSKGDSNRSITELIDSPRVRILRKEHGHKVTEDISDRLWSALGSAAHKLFEETGDDNHVTEERLHMDVHGWQISGAIDVQHRHEDNTVSVLDYKMTSVWSVMAGKIEWERQLNCYAALVRQVKRVEVRSLKVIAILRDWRSADAEKKADYPQAPIVEVQIPMWEPEEAMRYLTERVEAHQNAEFSRLTGEPLPLCDKTEQWARPASYARLKEGGVRAIRVYDSMEAAKADLQPGQLVVERPGEQVRCSGNWCRVSEWCDQYKQTPVLTEALD